MNIGKKPSYEKFIYNIPFIISCIAFLALNAISTTRIIVIVALIFILFVVSFFMDGILQYWKRNMSKYIFLSSAFLLGLFAYYFYSTMIFSSKLYTLSVLMGISVKSLVVLCSLAGFFVGFYFFSFIIELIYQKPELNIIDFDKFQNQTNIFILNKQEIVFITITAIVTISICSKSSPIYPFNDWVDSNCFMTVGKSMLHGLVPYKDLFEQKGPLLYIIHALAAFFSETTFIGVYFVEIVACLFFLLFSFKIMKLYQISKTSIDVLVIPVLALIVYSTPCFCHGDSAEELCLPLFSFAIYIAVKSIYLKQEPSWIEYLLIGITSSCVLWIKFSLLGFYIGWFCVIAYQLIKQKKYKKIILSLIVIALGVLITTIPILIYFIFNNALIDLWTVYFYDNIFLYSSTSEHFIIVSLIHNLLNGFENIYYYNFISVILMAIAAIAFMKKRDKALFASYLCMIFSTILLVYIGGQYLKYYSLILCVFIPFGIMAVYQAILQISILKKYILLDHKSKNLCLNTIFCAGCILLLFICSENTYLLKYSKFDMPQYKFAEIIAQKENATLLNYDFMDGGFYTTTGIVPNCKYFYKSNLVVSEMMQTQHEFVNQGKVDFVVTCNEELNSDLYVCVAESTFYFEGTDKQYYLYQLNTSTE